MISSYKIHEVLGSDPNKELLLPLPNQQKCGRCTKVFLASDITHHPCYNHYEPFDTDTQANNKKNLLTFDILNNKYIVRMEFVV